MPLLLSLIQVSVTCLAAHRIGALLIRTRLNSFSRPLKWSLEIAVGLIVISHTIFVATQLNLLSTLFLKLLFVCLSLLTAFSLFDSNWSKLLASIRHQLKEKPLNWGIILLSTCYLGWLVLNTALPPTAIDELTYHLEVPNRLIQTGGQTLFIDNVYAYFPQLADMFFLFGLGVGGEGAARLFHLLFAVLTGLAIFGFAREFLSARSSLLATALFLTIPSVITIAPSAYVDLTFSFFAFLAVVCMLEYVRTNQLCWAILMGVMAGGAWSTKYTGMQYLMILLLVLLIVELRKKYDRIPSAAILAPVIAFVIVAPYLLRNWVLTGWPLYPFNVGLFSLNPQLNWDAERASLFLRWLSGYGSGGADLLVDKLVSPILVFIRARFGDSSAYDGMLGYVFLFTPLLLIGSKRIKQFWPLLLFGLAFFYYWSFTTQQIRFLLPLMPVICFLLALGLEEKGSKWLLILVAILMTWNGYLGIRQQVFQHPFRYWTGTESRSEYLANRVLGYSLYEEANNLVGSEDSLYLINMGNFGYFLRCRWRADFVFEYFRLAKALEKAETGRELRGFFRSQEIKYLMINEVVTFSEMALEKREQRILLEFLRDYSERVSGDQSRSIWRILD